MEFEKYPINFRFKDHIIVYMLINKIQSTFKKSSSYPISVEIISINSKPLDLMKV
jgi:hypothetical protein